MKTINTDLGAFLKRTAGSLTMQHDGKLFIVKYYDISTRSQYLDDALESIAEETRRRANGMESVRETKPEPVKSNQKISINVGFAPPTTTANPPLPSISQAAQQAYQQQAKPSPVCPSCGLTPYAAIQGTGGNKDFYMCFCGHTWSTAP